MSEFYFTGRERTQPFTSGKYMADYTFDELRQMTAEITEEEKKDPFYKYYSETMAPLEPAHERVLAGDPLPPPLCYMPEKAGEILLSGSDKYPENGYGVLENGVGFAAILVHQDGMTDEMIKLYREEFCHTQNRLLFYKIWHPHMHMIHFEDGIVENWGWGFCRQDMNMSDFTFKALGISIEDIPKKDPHCLSFLGIGGRCFELDKPERPDWPMWMIQLSRETPDGRELRVLYYNGLNFHTDGTVSPEVNPDRQQTMLEMRCMYAHCVHEYTNELKLMKRFWQDRNGLS